VKRILAAFLVVILAVVAGYGYFAYRRDRNYRTLIARGEEALAAGDTFKAIEAFSGAITWKGDSMLGYLKRGETYRRRDQLEVAATFGETAPRPFLDAALRDLRKAAEIDPLAPRPYELIGDVNNSLRRFDRAADAYRTYLGLDDRSPRVLYKLGLVLYSSGQARAALEPLKQAVRQDADFAEAHYLTGLCARDLRRPREALAALERAMALAPAMLQAREELADLYGRLGRTDDRIAQLEALRALDSTASRDVALGLAYARAGRTESAIQALGRAVERYPDHGYTYVALGRVWLDAAQSRGDRVELSKALGALENAVKSDDSSEALMLFGRALLLADDDELAREMLQKATERLPVEPLAFYYLAQAAERNGDIGAARQALLDYHALEGDDPESRRRATLATRIADHSSRLGDHPAAITWYQRAVSAGHADAALFARLGEAQFKTGDLAAARASLTRALDLDPLDRTARALQRRLQ
jgi:tetratricopeptide (TPR) repeat protein